MSANPKRNKKKKKLEKKEAGRQTVATRALLCIICVIKLTERHSSWQLMPQLWQFLCVVRMCCMRLRWAFCPRGSVPRVTAGVLVQRLPRWQLSVGLRGYMVAQRSNPCTRVSKNKH